MDIHPLGRRLVMIVELREGGLSGLALASHVGVERSRRRVGASHANRCGASAGLRRPATGGRGMEPVFSLNGDGRRAGAGTTLTRDDRTCGNRGPLPSRPAAHRHDLAPDDRSLGALCPRTDTFGFPVAGLF